MLAFETGWQAQEKGPISFVPGRWSGLVASTFFPFFSFSFLVVLCIQNFGQFWVMGVRIMALNLYRGHSSHCKGGRKPHEMTYESDETRRAVGKSALVRSTHVV